MIKRSAEKYIEKLSMYFPVITIIGPRQSGKTTLAKLCFPGYQYCNLEDPDTRFFAENDPRAFLDKYNGTVILDEVQRVPSLLSFIQTTVDKQKKNADFILTGSHQPQLAQAISQSLAGRSGILRLYPFTQSEISEYIKKFSSFSLCLKGFYPVIHSENVPPSLFYPNYYQTYLERDIRQLVNLKNVKRFQTFIGLLAGRIGQLVNFNSIASDCGVSNNTVKEWISILEASFITYTLPPYFRNIRKRLVKSPKLYFTDTGLLCNLLGIESEKQIERDPLRGNIFENFVIIDLLKELYHLGKAPKVYFLRDSKGFEIDLLIEQEGVTKLVEIKSSATWNKDFHKNLNTGKLLFDGRVELYLVYSGKEKMKINDVNVLPASDIKEILFINDEL
jgi:uncharacterized protein